MVLWNRVPPAIGLALVNIYNLFHTNGVVYVEIDKGVLRGTKATTWNSKSYLSFKGIPYAQPPIGHLRFKGPKEEAAWLGVRDAIHHAEVCPQIDIAFRIFRGNEDCLYLNVFTPTLEGKRMPVMFWIHGGMFLLGSGNDELYGPDYFMSDGIVLVTINYRLGALGYLSTEDDQAPGNAGLKDQVAALKWVRRNIAKFGGDPDNVTIFGGSSGGASVHYHLLSPMSTGLFKRAIAQSGSAVNMWALSENPASLTIRLAEGLGAKNLSKNTTSALEFLRNASPRSIVRAQDTLKSPAEMRMGVIFLFSPSVERNVKSEEVFLWDSPLNIIRSGKFNKVPLIIGYNDNEGYFLKDEVESVENMRFAIQDTERYVPWDIKDKKLRNELGKSIRKFYFDDKPIGFRNISNFANLYSDTTFVSGLMRGTKMHLKTSNAPTWFYVFTYDGKINLIKYFMGINRPGAVHGDELGYLFHHRLLFWQNPLIRTSDDYVANMATRLWINFAKFGNPTPRGVPLNWKPATTRQFNYLNISGRDTRLSVNPDPERNKFWINAYETSDALRN